MLEILSYLFTGQGLLPLELHWQVESSGGLETPSFRITGAVLLPLEL